jgi:hypothetical protein
LGEHQIRQRLRINRIIFHEADQMQSFVFFFFFPLIQMKGLQLFFLFLIFVTSVPITIIFIRRLLAVK